LTNIRRNLIASIDPGQGDTPLLLTPVIPSLFVGVSVGTTCKLVGSGGTPPYSFSILSGSLPTGLSLNSSTGAITGTPSAQGGFSIVAQIADSGSLTFPRSVSFNVGSGLFPVYGHTTPPPGAKSTPYSFQVLMADVTGSTSGITYSVVSGSLPAGLSLNSSTGYITGSPTTIGTSWFTIRGTKSGATLDEPMSILINSAISAITGSVTLPNELRNMTIGIPVDAQIAFSAGLGVGTIVWSVSSGALPSGLSMDPKGRVTGTPSAVTATTYTQPTITLTDKNGATRAFTPSGANSFSVAAPVKPGARGTFVVMDSTGAPTSADFISGFFGDGSDLDVTIDGTTDPAWCTRVSGVNVAIRDAYVHDLTMLAGGELNMNGFDLYVSGTLYLDNAPANAITNRARPGAGGGAGVYGSQGGALGAGSVTNGSNGTGPTTPTIKFKAGGDGSFGGTGGHGTGTNVGGSGGGPSVATRRRPRAITQTLVIPTITDGVQIVYAGTGGGGGGGGAGNGTLAGTDGGIPGNAGGNLTIRARRVSRGASTVAACISVRGGDGADSANAPATGRASGGGAGAGGGGFLRLYYGELLGSSAANALNADGGNGGSAGTIVGGLSVTAGTGADGAEGGAIVLGDMLNGTGTITTGATGSAHSGRVGGTGGQCRAAL
jgi:hypothetical protein